MNKESTLGTTGPLLRIPGFPPPCAFARCAYGASMHFVSFIQIPPATNSYNRFLISASLEVYWTRHNRLRPTTVMAKRILSISYDRALLWTRQLLLEQLGCEVVSAEGFAQAWDAAEKRDNHFDLIILGHSIPPNDKEAIVRHMRDSCSCPILALLRPYESPVAEAALSIDAGDTNAFLTAVHKILNQN